jgi:uncharacterized protein
MDRIDDLAPVAPTAEQAEALRVIARSSFALMAALIAARSMGLSSWCIGAGAVRNLVWDHLHGRLPSASIDEIDLVYFDPKLAREHEQHVRNRLSSICPDCSWDVTNQAHVHQWYEESFGIAVPALRSLEEGIATWPEYATCVGLSLTAKDELQVMAPHGLTDLFALRVRHNPARATADVFAARQSSKRWAERWPRLRIVLSADDEA